MGAQLLSITLGSLLVILLIDLFVQWYGKFLMRWMPNIRIRTLLVHLLWALLAVIFWNSLYQKHLPETFTLTNFLFVLFIYSVRGLVESFVRKPQKETR